MSVSAWWDVWCDFPGCLTWCEQGGGRTKAEAFKSAKAFGWGHSKNGPDLCPEHVNARSVAALAKKWSLAG